MGVRASILALLVGLVAAAAALALVLAQVGAARDQHLKFRLPERASAEDSGDSPATPAVAAGGDGYADQLVVRWRQNPGDPLTIDAGVVAGAGADLAKVAKACLAAHAEQGHPVQCYVFASHEAYEYRNTTEDLLADKRIPKNTVPFAAVCYAIYAKREVSGKTTIGDMREAPQSWAAYDCPESWSGSS